MLGLSRRKNRQDLSVYAEAHTWSITICTDERRPLFRHPATVETVKRQLNQSSEKFRWDVLVYCFMSNHVHLLVAPNQQPSDLIKFISHFKQLSGYWYKQTFKYPLWQKSFHERTIDSEVEKQIAFDYILDNPVKAGIVTHWRQYPHIGSFVKNGHGVMDRHGLMEP